MYESIRKLICQKGRSGESPVCKMRQFDYKPSTDYEWLDNSYVKVEQKNKQRATITGSKEGLLSLARQLEVPFLELLSQTTRLRYMNRFEKSPSATDRG